MTSLDLQLVEKTIRGLMNPNNEERRISEQQLEQLMTNKPALILILSQLLISTSDKSILIYSAVVLRKLIQVSESESNSPVWKATSSDAQNQIKANVLTALKACNDKSLKRKIGDIITYLCESIYSTHNTWDDALKYIIGGFNLPLSEANNLTIESCVYLLSKIFNYAQRQLLEGIDVFLNGFNIFFLQGTLDIQTHSIEAICEMLSGDLDKKTAIKFKEFTFYILQTILNCLTQNSMNNLKISLFALSDLAHTEPKNLKKHFNDIFILMGKITVRKDLEEENVRGVAFEVVLSIIERYPSVISHDQEKLSLFINSIFKYAMEFDSTIDEDWLTPKTLSLSEEDFIPEDKLDEALSLIDRLLTSIKKEIALPIVSNVVMELLNHSTDDWRYKYIAYISIGKISDCIEDIASIDKIITMIFNDQNDSNPKIRYSCLYCITQFTSNFEDKFVNVHHQTVIPSLTSLFSKETVLRVKLQTCDTLQTILEKCDKGASNCYIQIILDALFVDFLKSDLECPVSLREGILDTFGQLVASVENSFKPYANKCFIILFDYLKVIIQSKDAKLMNLFGLHLETLTHVGTFCEEDLKKSTLDIAKILMHFQDNIENFKGDFGDLFLTSWERIIPYLIEGHKEIIPSIFDSIIKVIAKPPEMSIASNPNEKLDIQKFLSEINTNETKVEFSKEKLSLNTSETEDYSVFLSIFCIFLEKLREFALPYVEAAESQAKRLLSYPNSEIRSGAAQIYPLIIRVIHDKCSKEKLSEYAKKYLSDLIEFTEKELETSIIGDLLDAITDLLTDRDKILTQTELNLLFDKLFKIFDKIESNRIALLKEEKETATQLAESTKKKINSNDDEDSDEDAREDLGHIQDEISEIEDVLISFADSIGTIFKTHKELSIEIAKKILVGVLPKYFDQSASIFEKKMGLFILDDMVEHLGQELLSAVWTDIAKILLSYIDSPLCELRQASSFGLGEFAKHSIKDFNLYANDVFIGINKGLNVNADGTTEDEYGSAQDNLVTALGKMIKYQGNHYPLNEVIPLWFKYLPIVHDHGESAGMHELLCDIIIQSPTNILGASYENLPQIIRVLCKVVNSKKLSNDVINAKIMQILKGIKENPTLLPSVDLAKKDCKKDVLVKINKMFA